MTKVFTVFFCGTAANHKMVKGASESGSKKDFKFTDFYPEGEIVARLWAQQTGREFFDKIIVDGPGSGGLQLNGAYFMDPGGLRGRGHSDPHGGVTGVGWEQNIQHALGVIIGKSFRTEQSIQSFRGVNSNRTNFAGRGEQGNISDLWPVREGDTPSQNAAHISAQFYGEWTPEQRAELIKPIKLSRNKDPITTLNIVGWSRGAITAIMLANLISATKDTKRNDPEYNALKSLVNINIIAYDPVPGMNNFQTSRTALPGLVKTFVAFYARDDRSYGFTPVVPKPFDRTTNMVLLTLPGKHTTLVGKTLNIKGKRDLHLPPLDTAVDAALKAPYEVARILSEEYLMSWGTPIACDRRINNEQVLMGHYEVMTKEESIAQYKRERGMSLLGVRQANVKTRQYVNGLSPGYINTRYENLFICKIDNPPHTGNETGQFPATLPKQLILTKLFINWHHQLLTQKRSLSPTEIKLPEKFEEYHFLT